MRIFSIDDYLGSSYAIYLMAFDKPVVRPFPTVFLFIIHELLCFQIIFDILQMMLNVPKTSAIYGEQHRFSGKRMLVIWYVCTPHCSRSSFAVCWRKNMNTSTRIYQMWREHRFVDRHQRQWHRIEHKIFYCIKNLNLVIVNWWWQ